MNAINHLLIRGAFLLAAIVLTSCATVDKRFSNTDDKQHPAMQVFLDYKKASSASEKFSDEIKAFFSPASQRRIDTTMGWHKLVFTTSYKALRLGDCDSINIIENLSNSILISCKGPYNYQSAFGYSSDETMHLQVYVKKQAEQWYISTGGLTHTMDSGKSVPRSTGIKFKD